jgi:hypothetical protein
MRFGKYAVSRIVARLEEERAWRHRPLASFQTSRGYVTTGKGPSTTVSYPTSSSVEWSVIRRLAS